MPELYRSVGIAEIESKNWTLTPSKYIEFIDHDLDIDYPAEMARIQNEMKQIMAAEKQELESNSTSMLNSVRMADQSDTAAVVSSQSYFFSSSENILFTIIKIIHS